MNKMTAKNHTEAIRDYMEAYNKYVDMLDKYFPVIEAYNKYVDMRDKYFPVNQVIQGGEIKLGKILTAEVVHELDRLAKDAEEKRKIWMYFLRIKK